MSGLVESATAIMQMAERRLDVVARNVANISTPGYKRRIGFADMVNRSTGMSNVPDIAVRRDEEQGKLQQTGNPLDLAISGSGYFTVRNGDAMLYSRQGQFRRTVDGLLVTPQGYALQQAGGGDLVVEDDISIARDGTVLAGSRPLGRIALSRAVDGAVMAAVGESFFSITAGAMEDAAGATVRSGMVEGSNVELGSEMTQSMIAMRQAESGARLIQIYDDLMGRVVSAFGQAGGR